MPSNPSIMSGSSEMSQDMTNEHCNSGNVNQVKKGIINSGQNQTNHEHNNAEQDFKTDADLRNPPLSEHQKPEAASAKISSDSSGSTQGGNPSQRLMAPTPNYEAATTAGSSAEAKPMPTKTHGYRNGGSSPDSDIVSAPFKPRTGGDVRWDAINMISKETSLNLSNFRLLKRLGYGDIGSVYLVELRGTKTHYAMKVMEKASLVSRNKLLRAQTEREILGLLDHPFLPTLYYHFETDKFNSLVMEFCSGGNLHSLRQKQPDKYFTEEAAKFYASEVLLALEYLHMLGIVYRDLKPENVLVREEGHIMLSDFDLSLRCSVCPTLVNSSSTHGVNGLRNGSAANFNDENAVQGCMQPSSFFPWILPSKKNRKSKSDFGLSTGGPLPELMAEPTNVRSMSFVGTHEYLAPEIIRGEGHGSAVDWWTLGIFLYEILHGTTPFKGPGNRATLFNVVGQQLRFPETSHVSSSACDLIKGLLVKEPQKRYAYKRGATEIKQHPFFEGVNWALASSATPPHIPDPVDFSEYVNKESSSTDKKMTDPVVVDHKKHSGSGHDSAYVNFRVLLVLTNTSSTHPKLWDVKTVVQNVSDQLIKAIHLLGSTYKKKHILVH